MKDMDFVDYSTSSAAVSINLTTNTASGGDATGDVLQGVDGVIGSAYNDSLTGGAVIINVYTLDGAGNPTNTLDLFASTAASVAVPASIASRPTRRRRLCRRSACR